LGRGNEAYAQGVKKKKKKEGSGTRRRCDVLTNSVTPQREVPIPDFSFSPAQIQESVEASQDQYEYTRRANIQTLKQMFPVLDSEILEAVLEGCGEDLGVAIDRLLEM